MYAPTQETVKNHPYKHYSKYDLRVLFKAELSDEDYKKLSHFVFLNQRFKEPIPGTYSVYHMVPGGIAIATNALCINEWLKLHGLPVRPGKSQYTIEQKILFNGNDKRIDTRTPLSTSMVNKRGRPAKVEGPGSGNWEREAPEIQLDIWNWYSAGIHVNDIAQRLGCTVPNVYYHINKYKKANPKWKDDIKVDK